MNGPILAIDLGTSLGWALGKDGNLLASGQHELKQSTWDSGGARVLRCQHFVEDMVDLHQPAAVFFEKVEYVENTAAAHMYGALMGAISAAFEAHQVPCIGVGTGEWKKTFTGKGNASKENVVAVAQALRPHIVGRAKGGSKQSDEADAIGILVHGMKLMRERKV
jgi:Holliday junction resolvasome RuvABC endonuclease subunit